MARYSIKSVSVPSPFQVSDHSDEVESLLTLCLQHTDVFLKWEVRVPPQPKELRGLLQWQKCVSNPHNGGVSEPETGVQWNVRLCTCGLQTWNHSLSPIPVWNSLPAVDVSLWCPKSVLETRSPGHRQRVLEDVLGNTRGQLINLQSKTCHSQDTASWDTFLWVEFVRECCPNSDSDSPVPEIFWHKNRQSASEANPVKIWDDTILPGCLICFLQVKEETNCLLPLGKCIPEISL